MNYLGYHGTKTNIEQFSVEYQGRGSDQYGSGFYFTTNKDVARGYALEPTKDAYTGKTIVNENDTPTLITANICVENPFIISGEKYANLSGITPTFGQIKKIIKDLPSLYTEENNILGDYFEEYWENPNNKEQLINRLASEYYRNTDLKQLDILFADYPDAFHKSILKNMGHDGIVVEFVDTTHIIPWFSEQIEIIEKENILSIEEDYLKD